MVPVQSGEDWIARLDDDLSRPAEVSGDSFRISALQKEDPVCMTLHAWVVADEFPAWAEVKSMLPELRSLWHHRNNLSVDANGTLWRKRSSQSANLQLLVPKAGRERLFLSYHASLYGGHLGRTRTLARLADRFYWSGMADDVKDWLSQCVACIKRKSPVGRHHPLGNIPTGHRWDRIAMDILDVCDPTPEGFRYILVIADYFSKWTEAFPMKNKCADTVANILVESIILRFGMPLVIHSDQGREFENGLMKSLCALLGCTKTRTAPYHPESDGMIERFNRTCLMMLSMFVNDRRDNWHELLPFIMHAYRTSVHESTGYSPFRLMMGEECLLPQDVSTAELRTQRENDVAPHPFATWVRDALEVAYDHVRSSLRKTASRRKRLYDTKAVNRKFPVGSWVLRYYPPAAQHKLGSPWIGPHQVVRQATGHTVGIQRDADKPIIFVHVDDLKLCPGPQEITWTPIVSTAKSLCASTVAFRPGSEIGEVTPDPSVDVSAWEDGSDLHHDSTFANDLDRPVDLTGHILSPFYQRELIYQDCKFQSIAHLLCYRYAIINNQKTFATGIRKWSRILVDFPIPKFKSNTETQQWLEILADIYTYLCTTDERIRSALVETGPRPFTLECRSPWGRDIQHPDTAPHSCLVSDVLIGVRVAIASDTLTTCRWLGTKGVAVRHIKKGLLFAHGGVSLQLHRKDSALSGRVFTVGHSSIPPYSEAVLHCSVRTTGGRALPSSGLLEGLTLFAEDTGLIVGRTLVDPSRWKVPVLVSNFSQETVVVNPFTEVGMITQVTAIQSVADDGIRPLGATGELPYHLQDLVDQTSGDLDGGQRRRLAEVLLEYADIFPVPGDPLTGHTDAVEHDINTGDRSPIRCAPRRMSPQKMKKEEQCVTEMLTGGQIEASDSPWSSPVVLVTKKDGGTRFCVDYRQLNDATIKDAYPLPRIDDTLDMLAGKQWFSTLDLASGYWQVSLSREARAKTAFATHSGLFQFRVMPFGLCNAPATFERLMDRVLQGLRWSRCLVYLDDIISFGGTFDGALSNLTLIFERLRSYGLQLKSSKCHLFRVSVPFLGHIVGRQGLECDPTKIEDVKLWSVPDCLKSVRQFLGFVGYYRRFIPRFADVATPLVYLTGKDVPFIWDSSCSAAFHELHAALIDAPILAFPTETGQYILDTDASNFGLGGVLSQIQNDQERVVAYCSRALRPSQRRYCTTKCEMLAAVAMCIQFRSYLRGARFTLRTDHKSLVWLHRFKDTEGMMSRWLHSLQQFQFSIVHRPGNDHGNADGLSRAPSSPCRQCT